MRGHGRGSDQYGRQRAVPREAAVAAAVRRPDAAGDLPAVGRGDRMRDILGRVGRAHALTAAIVAGIGLLAGLPGCGSNAASPNDAGDGGAVVEPEVGDDFDA